MSMIDSNVVFESRARAIGLPHNVIDAMGLRGWTTYATFAFSATSQSDDQAFTNDVIVPLLTDPNHVHAAKLRRLFFESHTLNAADLRRKVEASESEAPRKLPPPEIAQRMELLQQRIRPILIADALEPSHHLINAVVQCVEDGRVRYIEWTKCTSRTQEVNNVKEDQDLKMWKTDSSGTIKAVSKDPAIKATLDTELDVHNALRRRGVAYEIAQAMTFETHEKIINRFFHELKREPLEGYSAVTMQQIAAADREMHVRLAESTRAGMRPGPNGELPLDIPATEILEGAEIRWMLMPMPKRSAGSNASHDVASPKKQKVDSEPKKPNTPKKSKDDALKLKRMKRTPMPKQLVGCIPCDEDGKPFCFGYNLGACSEKSDCKRGMHRCCKKGCGKRHPFCEAHKGES